MWISYWHGVWLTLPFYIIVYRSTVRCGMIRGKSKKYPFLFSWEFSPIFQLYPIKSTFSLLKSPFSLVKSTFSLVKSQFSRLTLPLNHHPPGLPSRLPRLLPGHRLDLFNLQTLIDAGPWQGPGRTKAPRDDDSSHLKIGFLSLLGWFETNTSFFSTYPWYQKWNPHIYIYIYVSYIPIVQTCSNQVIMTMI